MTVSQDSPITWYKLPNGTVMDLLLVVKPGKHVKTVFGSLKIGFYKNKVLGDELSV